MKVPILTVALLYLLLYSVYSQEFREEPFSYSRSINLKKILEISIPDPGPIPDNSKTVSKKSEYLGMETIGVGVSTNFQFKQNASIVFSDTSGTLYIFKITSPKAEGLALVIDSFSIPQHAKLFVYGKSKLNYKGPYLKPNIENKPVRFNVGPYYEDAIFIEYFEPLNPEFIGDFKILYVSVIKKKRN